MKGSSGSHEWACVTRCSLCGGRGLFCGRTRLSRLFKPFVFVMAGIYFPVDAAILVLANPVIRRLAEPWIFDRLRTRVMAQGPYPTPTLFVMPLLILEPAKPFAAYLTATGHVISRLMVRGIAQFLKLVLIKRRFRISRDKLMSIPAFCCGGHAVQIEPGLLTMVIVQNIVRGPVAIPKRAPNSQKFAIVGKHSSGGRAKLSAAGWLPGFGGFEPLYAMISPAPFPLFLQCIPATEVANVDVANAHNAVECRRSRARGAA